MTAPAPKKEPLTVYVYRCKKRECFNERFEEIVNAKAPKPPRVQVPCSNCGTMMTKPKIIERLPL